MIEPDADLLAGAGLACGVSQGKGYAEVIDAPCDHDASLWWKLISGGTVGIEAATGIDLAAGADMTVTATGTFGLDADGQLTIQSLTSIRFKAGASEIVLTPTGISIHGKVTHDGGELISNGITLTTPP